MGKGDGGLSIDSDPFRLFFHHRLTLHAPPLHMDHAFQFPVNLNSGDTDAPPPPTDDSGKAKPEMDFFAISRSKALHHHREGGLTLVGDDPSKTSDNDVNTGLNLLMMNTTAVEENGLSSKPEENPKTEVAELQAELEQLAGENQRLRNMLTQATSDYNSLQMQLIAVMEDRKCDNNPDPETNRFDEKKEKLPVVPRQFMDLGLAEPTFDVQNMEENSRSSSDGGRASLDRTEPNNELEAVSRGSDPESRNAQCKEPGRRTSSRLRERSPDQELSIWNSKLPRFNSPPPKSSVEQAATEATMRKARVSVRARSESNMISDGCQWRKYGQKMAKGNPCPRAYYRCTMTGNCPVRKQVQRCAEDRTILVTTYEGNHNHPLPPAAMAMASTTSSAARMLLSGSMSSTDSIMNANFLARTLLPCSSTMATISASAPFPTVTLDLTQSPNSNSLLQTPSNQLQVPFMNPNQSFQNPSAALLPIFRQALFNQTKFSGLQTSQDLKGGSSENQTQGSDNLTAATAAIAADPNFTAALAAAISSIMGGSSQPNGGSSSAPANAANGSGKISNSTN